MSLALVREVLSTLVLLVVVVLFAISLWAIYSRFRNGQPADRSRHRCCVCSKEFQCRAVPPKPTLNSSGDIILKTETNDTHTIVETKERRLPQTNQTRPGVIRIDTGGRAIVRRRIPGVPPKSTSHPIMHSKPNNNNNVNSFQRRTVHVGSFPVEISEPGNKNCCSLSVNADKPPERFCSYKCYRTLIKTKQ